MLYPDDKFKTHWDMYITLVLLLTCFLTPYRQAFDSLDTYEWNAASYTLDICLLVDIIIIFNSAYTDDDFRLIEDRKTIACVYLKSWFWIDIVAIIPFDLFFGA
jgi:hypothetical protein